MEIRAFVRLTVRSMLLQDLVRLVPAVHYSERMKRAGVPEKVRRKILRRWTSAFCWAKAREMAALIEDLRSERRIGWDDHNLHTLEERRCLNSPDACGPS